MNRMRMNQTPDPPETTTLTPGDHITIGRDPSIWLVLSTDHTEPGGRSVCAAKDGTLNMYVSPGMCTLIKKG